jgi:hypothetical protein
VQRPYQESCFVTSPDGARETLAEGGMVDGNFMSQVYPLVLGQNLLAQNFMVGYLMVGLCVLLGLLVIAIPRPRRKFKVEQRTVVRRFGD